MAEVLEAVGQNPNLEQVAGTYRAISLLGEASFRVGAERIR